jgi:hypothetical protein
MAGTGAFPGEAPGHHGDECPVQVGFGVLRQAFVVACVAAGVHAPADRALDFPAAGQDDEALRALRPGDDTQGEPEAFTGPVHEVAGVSAVGPDLGDLRLGEAQASEHVAGGVAVLDVGGCHRDHHGQSERVHGDMSFAAVILSSPILLVPDLVCCVVDGVLDGLVSRGR